jgi:hypothetical protein
MTLTIDLLCYIAALICFLICFLAPVIRVGTDNQGRPVYLTTRPNWMCGGFMFMVLSLIV